MNNYSSVRAAIEKRIEAGHNYTCPRMLVKDHACCCGHDMLLDALGELVLMKEPAGLNSLDEFAAGENFVVCRYADSVYGEQIDQLSTALSLSEAKEFKEHWYDKSTPLFIIAYVGSLESKTKTNPGGKRDKTFDALHEIRSESQRNMYDNDEEDDDC